MSEDKIFLNNSLLDVLTSYGITRQEQQRAICSYITSSRLVIEHALKELCKAEDFINMYHLSVQHHNEMLGLFKITIPEFKS